MSNVLFTAQIDDHLVVPYVRLTQKSKWTKKARRYLDSQAYMAYKFKEAFKGKEPIKELCIISYAVYLNHRRCVDSSNVLKALEDALQYGRVVENDVLIRGTDITRLYKKTGGPLRIAVTLKRFTENPEGDNT